MYDFVQPGKSVSYVLGEDIDHIPDYAIPVEYGTKEGEVVVATEDTKRFAGVITAVTIQESGQAPYVTYAKAGTRVTVIKEGIIVGKADGAISFGDPVAVGKNGTFKSIATLETSPTLALLLTYVGRAENDAADGEIVKIRISQK